MIYRSSLKVHSMELKQSSTDEAVRGWVFPALLVGVLLLVALVSQRIRQHEPVGPNSAWTPSLAADGEIVSLRIDFGNGAIRQFDLPWQPEMTIEGLLLAAREFSPGITYVQQGKGETGYLSALEGLSGEGAGGRNWKYEVDGEYGKTSFCLQKLTPGQQVVWKFSQAE